MSDRTFGGLNAFVIKCLAMLAMTLDHVAWAFLDVNSHLSEWLHFIGRMVAPIMVYLLVVGYYHTHDVMAYARRLLVFALIAQLPYWMFSLSIESILQGMPWQDYGHGNVLFTLFCALMALIVYHNSHSTIVKLVLIVLMYPVVQLFDYGFALVAMALLFAYFYHDTRKPIIAYVLACPVFYVLTYGFERTVGLGYMHFGMLLAAVMIYYFNGEKGSNFGGRYLFYWFYPVHLLIIALLAYALG